MKHSSETRRLDRNESARLLRRRLRAAFPETKFSVTLGRGTAWSSCYVRWTGELDAREVRAIAEPFETQGFDGMTDSRTYRTAELVLETGERVESGLGMLLFTRNGFCA